MTALVTAIPPGTHGPCRLYGANLAAGLSDPLGQLAGGDLLRYDIQDLCSERLGFVRRQTGRRTPLENETDRLQVRPVRDGADDAAQLGPALPFVLQRDRDDHSTCADDRDSKRDGPAPIELDYVSAMSCEPVVDGRKIAGAIGLDSYRAHLITKSMNRRTLRDTYGGTESAQPLFVAEERPATVTRIDGLISS